jgi:hypothetical protein
MSEYYIAQINIARMLAPIDDPVMVDFVAQLPPINALAEGRTWKLFERMSIRAPTVG